jgi:hypothetical protein
MPDVLCICTGQAPSLDELKELVTATVITVSLEREANIRCLKCRCHTMSLLFLSYLKRSALSLTVRRIIIILINDAYQLQSLYLWF